MGNVTGVKSWVEPLCPRMGKVLMGKALMGKVLMGKVLLGFRAWRLGLGP